MSDELLLGEVTDEVRAFLESQGRQVPPKAHVYLGPPGRPRLQSRHVVHDPPHWRIKIQPGRVTYLQEFSLLEIEVGERVAVAMYLQSNFEQYLAHLPAYMVSQEEKCQTSSTKIKLKSAMSLLEQIVAREGGLQTT